MQLRILFYSLGLSIAVFANAQDWENLIKKDLSNWRQLGGKAAYDLKDGVITGTSIENTPNSFLASNTVFSDFILEFEVFLDPSLNSGVQIRSNSKKEYENGRVHGYQVELDPTERGFSGGIYDEGRRGWMYPLSRNPKARTAFKNGTWNTIHVEAIGSVINTWINGIHCANLIDDMTRSGFIALQVHQVYQPEQVGKTIKWRNIRILKDQPEHYTWEKDPDVPVISFLINQLTTDEKRKGWRLLWDGQSTAGWTGKGSSFPSEYWNIESGVLSSMVFDETKISGSADIITTDVFADFELEMEFKITKGANSGIFYYMDDELKNGYEYQLIDDGKFDKDTPSGAGGNLTLGALDALIGPENRSIPGRGKQFKGLDKWNQVRITSKDGIIEHWLNNEKIIECDRNTQLYNALVANAWYRNVPGFANRKAGVIMLQNHGQAVSFRSIKIREF